MPCKRRGAARNDCQTISLGRSQSFLEIGTAVRGSVGRLRLHQLRLHGAAIDLKVPQTMSCELTICPAEAGHKKAVNPMPCNRAFTYARGVANMVARGWSRYFDEKHQSIDVKHGFLDVKHCYLATSTATSTTSTATSTRRISSRFS